MKKLNHPENQKSNLTSFHLLQFHSQFIDFQNAYNPCSLIDSNLIPPNDLIPKSRFVKS